MGSVEDAPDFAVTVQWVDQPYVGDAGAEVAGAPKLELELIAVVVEELDGLAEEPDERRFGVTEREFPRPFDIPEYVSLGMAQWLAAILVIARADV